MAEKRSPRRRPPGVTERDGQARLEEVQVYNGTSRSVLILEGELLEGGFQDRIVSSSILLPQQSACIVPTVCSEEGRFEGQDVHLRSSGLVASPPESHSPRRTR